MDTGAAISVISRQIVPESVQKINFEVNIFGIVGKDVSVKTQGMVSCIFNIESRSIEVLFHMIETRYLENVDGECRLDLIFCHLAKQY